MDMGELIAFLRTGRTPDGNTSFFPYIWIRNVGVAAASVVLAAIWHKAYYVPQTVALAELRAEYAAYDEKAKAMPKIEANIARMETFISGEKPAHMAALDKFYGNDTIDAAYHTVSDVARRTDMTVLSIKSGDIKKEEKDLLAPADPSRKLIVTPIPVNVKLKGSYQNFLRFIAQMQDAAQIYAVGSENLTLSDDDGASAGFIESDVTLAAFSVDKADMLPYLSNATQGTK